MIIRQLRPSQYERLHRDLIENAHAEPLEASYTPSLRVSGVAYAVKIQPETRCRMVALQAYRIERDAYGQDFERITGGALLSALLELLVAQGVR